jgi:hypothetical protein
MVVLFPFSAMHLHISRGMVCWISISYSSFLGNSCWYSAARLSIWKFWIPGTYIAGKNFRFLCNPYDEVCLVNGDVSHHSCQVVLGKSCQYSENDHVEILNTYLDGKSFHFTALEHAFVMKAQMMDVSVVGHACSSWHIQYASLMLCPLRWAMCMWWSLPFWYLQLWGNASVTLPQTIPVLMMKLAFIKLP